ncbi:MAG: phosphatidylserine decarboxylase [Deltaproteobacteria bacterium]|nr:phosphatidylserine decarboxylase [Candidatus Anaeroferrophillacea bacterium]
MMSHQYIERQTGEVRSEELYADRVINFLYSTVRERGGPLFRAVTGRRMSAVLGAVNFDLGYGPQTARVRRFLARNGVDFSECLVPEAALKTMRQVFERQIRYWDCRPMDVDPAAVVSPADARVVVGTMDSASLLFLKEKFFSFPELLGGDRERWQATFVGGDAAIFRLTPDKYHYNHCPVTGVVADCYEVDGCYHSCNPTAVVRQVTPYSKNRRVVTVIDTDVDGGSRVGLVAMIEVVALMIGDIVQCYSAHRYDDPQPVEPGMRLEKGRPKSLYRPGSSTDILLFQPGRVEFAADLVANRGRPDAASRFTIGFNTSLVETEVRLRSTIARAAGRMGV